MAASTTRSRKTTKVEDVAPTPEHETQAPQPVKRLYSKAELEAAACYNDAYAQYVRFLATKTALTGDMLTTAHNHARTQVLIGIATNDLDCPKCGGTGTLPAFSQIEGGRCFRCNPPPQPDRPRAPLFPAKATA